jgi:pimeloyl-ACP methyl ester carboxylesterase
MLVKKWLLRLLGGVLGLVLALAAAGALYQELSERRDMSRFPPPGELVEVEGRRMHIDCRGEGSPTVVVELGLTEAASLWGEMHDDMARLTRVCLYDRAGLGYSAPVRRTAVASEVAERLDQLLAAAGIDDDLVLVGFSAGGLYVRELARRSPERVRAMLLIDSTHEQQGARQPEPLEPNSDTALRLARYLGPLGVVRLSGMVRARFERFRGPDELRDRLVALYEQSHTGATMLREWGAFELDTHGEAPSPLGDLLLIVLSEGRPIDASATGARRAYLEEKREVDIEMQRELAALSTRGRQIVATESGHAIHRDQPELVLDSLRELVEAVLAESPRSETTRVD